MTRSELHAAVWARPMFHVAQQLGVGERALAATCKRAAIPTPPRGYWRQVSTGQTPARAELTGAADDVVKLPSSVGKEKAETAPPSAAWPFRGKAAEEADATVPSPGQRRAADVELTGLAHARGTLRVSVALLGDLARELRHHEDMAIMVAAVGNRISDLPTGEAARVAQWMMAVRAELAQAHPVTKLLRLLESGL